VITDGKNDVTVTEYWQEKKEDNRNLTEKMNRPYEFWYYFSACEGLKFVISHR